MFERVQSIFIDILQQKLKEEREARRAHLDERHEYLLSTIANCLGLEKSEVEDGILEDSQIQAMDDFFKADGSKQIMFFYQEPEAIEREGVEHVRLGASGNKPIKSNKPKVFVTNGYEVALHGQCLMFYRANPSQAITATNITQEISFTLMDSNSAANGNGLLNAIQSLLTSVYIPSLRKMNKGWGHLDTQFQKRNDFLNTLDGFVSVLDGAQDTLEDKVQLKECEREDLLKNIRGPSDYNNAANNTETLMAVEECMAVWMKQIEQVLAESEQMRREADNIGPRAELDYWKKRMSRFNFILDQLKGNEVKKVLGILAAAKSKTIRQWQDLDRRITDYANEAKDNVKYLYTLEKFCDPLYNSDPVGMLDAIPGLINAIRMIHSISRFYNTSKHMTSLFVKITNQMITACKAYITDGGIETIWTQETSIVLKKLNNCIKLYDSYQTHFHKTKEKLEEMPEERQFDFSGVYIFGKMDIFTKRLRMIIEMFETMGLYSHLADSKIEGMEIMNNKFQVIVTSMKKKSYDFLDHRRQEFYNDFEDFKRQINDLHSAIVNFMDQRFERIHNTQFALGLLKKFERLGLPNLGVEEKYQRILSHYSRDIEAITKTYSRNKSEPPIPRDLPPIAGKITWARQLYRRIQEPMDAFQRHPSILQTSEAKKIIKNYNKLAKVLLEFEMIFHRLWIRQVEAAKSGLQASLLVRHPENPDDLFVNFDQQILTLIRETESMIRLQLEIPQAAQGLRAKHDYFKKTYNELTVI